MHLDLFQQKKKYFCHHWPGPGSRSRNCL